MKFISTLIALLAVHVLVTSATTWYNFFPYTSNTCTGTPYGVGMTFLYGTSGYCSTNIEGAFNQMVNYINSSAVKLQFYGDYPSLGTCSAPSMYAEYALGQCQDGNILGFNMLAGIKWGANYMVNSSSVPRYIYTVDQSNPFWTFMSTDCTSVLAYMYMNGNTTISDNTVAGVNYNYFCSNGLPYVITCTNGVCGAPASISSSCIKDSGYFMSKMVTCI